MTSRPFRWPRGLRIGSADACFLGLGLESRRGHGCLPLVGVVYCEIEVSATCRSLVQGSLTDCMSERDPEISAMRKTRATRTVEPSQIKSRVMKILIWVCGSGRRD